jgi:hypothetical protein
MNKISDCHFEKLVDRLKILSHHKKQGSNPISLVSHKCHTNCPQTLEFVVGKGTIHL